MLEIFSESYMLSKWEVWVTFKDRKGASGHFNGIILSLTNFGRYATELPLACQGVWCGVAGRKL